MLHPDPSDLAGTTVKISGAVVGADEPVDFRVEDWWDRIAGRSWMDCDGNPACLQYAIRGGLSGGSIPIDNHVLYGKVGGFGHLVHVSEVQA